MSSFCSAILHDYIYCRLLPLCLLALTLTALGQAASDWRQLRTQLEAEIASRVQAELLVAVRPEAIAAANGFPWPVPNPPQKLEQIYAQAEVKLQAELERELPEQLVTEIHQEALRRHGYWKVGDEVTLQTRGKMSHTLTGRLQAVTPARVKIANRWLSAVDLDDEVMARFFPEQAEQAQKKYVDREMRRLNLRRQSFTEAFRQQQLPILLRQNGYLPIVESNGPEYLSPINWISRGEVMAQKLFAARQEKAAEIQREIEQEVFAEHGFYHDPSTKQWLPETDRQFYRGKRKPARRTADDSDSAWNKLKKLFQ